MITKTEHVVNDMVATARDFLNQMADGKRLPSLPIPKHQSYYVASPYTSYDSPFGTSEGMRLDEAWKLSCMFGGELTAQGYDIFVPIAHGHALNMEVPLPETHDFWMRVDLPHLRRMDAMIVLCMPGWDVSKGIREEMITAVSAGKTIYFVKAEFNWLSGAEVAGAPFARLPSSKDERLHCLTFFKAMPSTFSAVSKLAEFAESPVADALLYKHFKDAETAKMKDAASAAWDDAYKGVLDGLRHIYGKEKVNKAMTKVLKDAGLYGVGWAETKVDTSGQVSTKHVPTPSALTKDGKQAVLQEAMDAVKARGANYGAVRENFERIAARWNVHLHQRYGITARIDADDVGCMMIDVKLARMVETPMHWDSLVDIAGYASCLGELAQDASYPDTEGCPDE